MFHLSQSSFKAGAREQKHGRRWGPRGGQERPPWWERWAEVALNLPELPEEVGVESAPPILGHICLDLEPTETGGAVGLGQTGIGGVTTGGREKPEDSTKGSSVEASEGA